MAQVYNREPANMVWGPPSELSREPLPHPPSNVTAYFPLYYTGTQGQRGGGYDRSPFGYHRCMDIEAKFEVIINVLEIDVKVIVAIRHGIKKLHPSGAKFTCLKVRKD